jgi:hypothetical protein
MLTLSLSVDDPERASHGRRGLSAILVGSETLKVLTHSKIPVLVHRRRIVRERAAIASNQGSTLARRTRGHLAIQSRSRSSIAISLERRVTRILSRNWLSAP